MCAIEKNRRSFADLADSKKDLSVHLSGEVEKSFD